MSDPITTASNPRVGLPDSLTTYSNATDRERLSKLVGSDVDGERLARIITDASQWAEHVSAVSTPGMAAIPQAAREIIAEAADLFPPSDPDVGFTPFEDWRLRLWKALAPAPSPEAGAGGDLFAEAVDIVGTIKRTYSAGFCISGELQERMGRFLKLVASTGSGKEKTKGEPASPSGSQAAPEAPSDPRPVGFDPSRAWQDISTAPTDDRLILAGCPACEQFPEGRVMIWRASMLNRNQKGPTPQHLSFPATHWAPLLPAPAAGGRPESYRSEYRLAAWLVSFAQKQLDENRDWHSRNRLRWAAEALIGEDAVLALAGEARRAETEGLGSRASDGEAGTPDLLSHLRAENANLRDRVREAERAMRPFAGSVFNDNGDVTISTGHLTAQDWLAARRFHLSLSPEPQEAGDHEPR